MLTRSSSFHRRLRQISQTQTGTPHQHWYCHLVKGSFYFIRVGFSCLHKPWVKQVRRQITADTCHLAQQIRNNVREPPSCKVAQLAERKLAQRIDNPRAEPLHSKAHLLHAGIPHPSISTPHQTKPSLRWKLWRHRLNPQSSLDHFNPELDLALSIGHRHHPEVRPRPLHPQTRRSSRPLGERSLQ